ncbi:MAG: hypothetical protein O2999_04460 [Nitrospirae bacterium]|nr:hypothetical protein [Nitrospirota bacterium]MDA1303541.1 hypothetical protein [Nitrospirota bacterium]
MDFVFFPAEGEFFNFAVGFLENATFFFEGTPSMGFLAEAVGFFIGAAFFLEDVAGFAFLAEAVGFLGLAAEFFDATDFLALMGFALVTTFLGVVFLLEVAKTF